LSKVCNGGECYELHGLWLVLLKSAKDRGLGVDTIGQYVPSRIRYGMTYLLIRDIVGSVSCSDEWEVTWSFTQAHMVQEGSWYHVLPSKNLSIAMVSRTTLAKSVIRLIVNLYNDI
jgi:hypothetical protein